MEPMTPCCANQVSSVLSCVLTIPKSSIIGFISTTRRFRSTTEVLSPTEIPHSFPSKSTTTISLSFQKNSCNLLTGGQSNTSIEISETLLLTHAWTSYAWKYGHLVQWYPEVEFLLILATILVHRPFARTFQCLNPHAASDSLLSLSIDLPLYPLPPSREWEEVSSASSTSSNAGSSLSIPKKSLCRILSVHRHSHSWRE